MNARFRMAGNVGVSTGGTGQGSGTGGLSSTTNRGKAAYTPSTVSLIALVVFEVLAYGWLRYYFRHAHGG